ncbi:unnamed protein product [Linum tenue]|uniref:Calcium uniporter protein C-terminal domain-containing protein n=1 Tax=Linum tenue TaxID=586396 RepID=A0AAV0LNM3_9ROSI|nr:unnamed protein product [Linum tenue]
MAFRKLIYKRLSLGGSRSPSPAVDHPPKPTVLRDSATAAAEGGVNSHSNSRRFYHRTALRNHLPYFLSFPVGEKLREQLRLVNFADNRLQLTGLNPPPSEHRGFSIEEARKILRLNQMEKLKARLRKIPASSIPLPEFAQICVQECGKNEEQGAEFAKTLDRAGNVIVLGNIVFLRPAQVAKSMEITISQSIGVQNDPRRRALEEMEKQKAVIDERARAQVRAELYCGLGYLTAQTVGFMRLTFWELSWDVMEPICFFAASVHFGLAYAFFLRTSTEPTFEGYFRRRFQGKQKKLMKLQGFDLEKYEQLCRAFEHSRCG